MAGMFLTAYLGIKNIKRVAVENRISRLHEEMLESVSLTIEALREIGLLLHHIGDYVCYVGVNDNNVRETAYARYVRTIEDSMRRCEAQKRKLVLVAPRDLYSRIIDILPKINRAEDLLPDSEDDPLSYCFPEEYAQLLSTIDQDIGDAIDLARQYLGTDKLPRVVALKSTSIAKLVRYKGWGVNRG
jgi:hypothetical protein